MLTARSTRSPILLSIACTLLAAHAAWAQWPTSPTVNVPLCTASGDQDNVRAVSDGAGGAIVTWVDSRDAGVTLEDIYAQRVNADGTIAAGWPVNGVAICTNFEGQSFPAIVSDGAGGAIIVWQDYRSELNNQLFAQRIDADGVVQWTADGVDLCTGTGDQTGPSIISDGASGAIVAWADARGAGGGAGMYAQRITSAGAVSWAALGVKLNVGFTSAQTNPPVVADGAGGAIFAFMDTRLGGGIAGIDIFGQHLTATGTLSPGWPAAGLALAVEVGQQWAPVMIPDGLGGAILAWEDSRAGAAFVFDIYALRFLGTGTFAPGWAATGNPVCVAAGSQTGHAIVPDQAGGAVVSWADPRSDVSDIYAQRISQTGAIAPGWAVDGEEVCAIAGNQSPWGYNSAASDEDGGIFVAWQDGRTGAGMDVFTQRMTGAGVTAPAIDPDGVAVSTPGIQEDALVVGDGSGGVIVIWVESGRVGSSSKDTYAQKVEHNGYLGYPAGVIADVRDIPGDQGGHVRVDWEPSDLDVFPGLDIDSYALWRQVPAATALAALSRGGVLLDAGTRAMRASSDWSDLARSKGVYRPTSPHQAAGAPYWELVVSTPARGFSGYSYTASTVTDSTGDSNRQTIFMVQTVHEELAGENFWWDSDPDSGYSVDNLAPSAPSAFVAQYFTETPGPQFKVSGPAFTWLHWGVSPEADLLEYRLHRGASAGFVPGPGNLITAQPDTGYQDVGPPGNHYKLLVVDTHGNTSTSALLSPGQITGIEPPSVPAELALALPAPNPAREETSVRLQLPRAAFVSLRVRDVLGRTVRDLIHEQLGAGEHPIRWDARAESGERVASGIYFLQLEVEGQRLRRRVAVLR